jgi:hypothetical protein
MLGDHKAKSCQKCLGFSRARRTDCTRCGGSALEPPDRNPDAQCRICERDLWANTRRSTLWFEDRGGRAICRWCLDDHDTPSAS